MIQATAHLYLAVIRCGRLWAVYRWGRVWYEELCRWMTSKICIIVLSFCYSFKIFPTEKHVYLKQCKVPIFTTIGSLSSHGDDDKVKKPLVLWAKQQLGMCIMLLVHLFDVHCTTTMQNLLMQHFVGDVKIRWEMFYFSFCPWIKSLRIQLQEKLPSFDKLSGSK